MRSFASFFCIASALGCVVGCSGGSRPAGGLAEAEAGAAGRASEAEGGATGETVEATAGAGGAQDPVDCTKWGPVDEDETWAPVAACPDGFDVPSSVEIGGAGTVLTIEPGTKLKFGDEAMLKVLTGAALAAVGTEDEPILFTGWQPSPGSWGGILFHSNALSNEISHAIVEYAGSTEGASGNVTMSSKGGGRIKLTSTVLRRGAKFGLTVLETGGLVEFADNTITENEGGAIRVEVAAVHELNGEGNTIVDNGKDNQVSLEGLASRVEGDVTWPALSPAIYRVSPPGGGATDITVKGHLTISAGAIFEFVGGSGIGIDDGSSGLAALGTEDQPIIFRGVDGSGWSGIGYCESNWASNALEHVEIYNALGPVPGYLICGPSSSGVGVGNLSDDMPSRLRVKNVTFGGPNNAKFDIGVTKPSVLEQEGTNTGTGVAGKLQVGVAG
ncbi:MAG TPA: hypothetical protein VJN18_01670 [Polyangiaceae bacterium]|nr:hypothetical protein [Polyangiaceae bacterium]